MLNALQLAQFQRAFPFFNNDAHLLNKLQSHCQLVSVPANTILCDDGQISADLPLLISGLIRVYKVSESGKEITLYHIEDEESCILTASTILGGKKFPAIAKTAIDSQIVVLPEVFVREWIVQSKEWQQFIFGLVAQRLTDVITVVEEVAFQRIDRRIAKFLCRKQALNGSTLSITHQDIAAEVGTAREVVTRVLQDLKYQKILSLSRGKIKITELEQLIKLSAH